MSSQGLSYDVASTGFIYLPQSKEWGGLCGAQKSPNKPCFEGHHKDLLWTPWAHDTFGSWKILSQPKSSSGGLEEERDSLNLMHTQKSLARLARSSNNFFRFNHETSSLIDFIFNVFSPCHSHRHFSIHFWGTNFHRHGFNLIADFPSAALRPTNGRAPTEIATGAMEADSLPAAEWLKSKRWILRDVEFGTSCYRSRELSIKKKLRYMQETSRKCILLFPSSISLVTIF